ncbi:MAG: divalent-cation tolerance protein CutA [endosymbiont of Escarpia spicata]|uniref:Divalent-cation tolerance protein CutA n=1 Tax=endosymbiont of Escarpia spicata TaxID=2200908 RepID=A0A370DPG2_9GAMM|nr:MAG: divalent-cation tolerance protein CutA [endosymbiont of Escarpia spicata]
MPTKLLLVHCTVPDHQTGLQLAQTLVSQGLAACVNITAPVTSVYRWEGKLESANEHLLLIKTTKQHYDALEARIRAHHPYELPEIIAVPVEQGLDGYLDWVEKCTTTNS